MSITLKTNVIKYRDNHGNYISFNAAAQETVEEQIAQIQAAAATEKTAIAAKGLETRDTIPQDYIA